MIENKYPAERLLKAIENINDRSNFFAICPLNLYWPIADKLKALGVKGFLPTKEDRELESDREAAKEFVQKNYKGLEVAEHQEFKTIEEAIKFLSENENLYVLKGFSDDAPTVVPNGLGDVEINHAEIENSLKTNQKFYESEGFILEEKINDIIEFTPEATSFDGKVLGVSVDVEAKPLGAGDTGYMTGCSLNTIFWIPPNSEIYNIFLKPQEELMLRKNELTVWDASVLYSPSKDKFYFGEFCENRWGYDSIFAEIATLGSATKYFENLVKGEELIQGAKKFGSSIRIFNLLPDLKIPGRPLADSIIITEPSDLNIWLWDAKQEEDKLMSVGYDKDLATVSGAADTFEESVRESYKNLKEKFYFGEMYYRPEFDFLSKDYPTSITNRLNFVLNKFKLTTDENKEFS